MKSLGNELLVTWAEGLMRTRHEEVDVMHGGLLCPACGRIHGRSAEAMLPFLYVADLTGDQRFARAAEDLFWWSERNVACYDGSYINDPCCRWKGTTVFTARCYLDCLAYYRDDLSDELADSMTRRVRQMMDYLVGAFDEFDTNINYFFAGADVLHRAGLMLNVPQYREKSASLFRIAKRCIGDDGIMYGEGKPKLCSFLDATEGGSRALDVGYNVEENLPSLVSLALSMQDEELIKLTKRVLHRHLLLMLPDGAWDNSWGSRNAKWSYWGSRTSDGCVGAYAFFPDAEFQWAAYQNYQLLKRCTHDGLLMGGMDFAEAGEPTCLHHTICHANALAACLCHGGTIAPVPQKRPRADGCCFLDGHNVAVVRQGPWYASVSTRDFVYEKGSTPSGGSLTMLHHRQWGPIMAATMSEYRLCEPFNMQYPLRGEARCGTMRIEVDGFRSDTFLRSAMEQVADGDGAVRLAVRGKVGSSLYRMEYTVSEDSVEIRVQTDAPEARLVLPLIVQGDVACTWSQGAVVLQRDHPLRASLVVAVVSDTPAQLGERFFNPVGGFLYRELVINLGGLDETVDVRLTVAT